LTCAKRCDGYNFISERGFLINIDHRDKVGKLTIPDENHVIPKIKCPNCGLENLPDAQICSHCGKPMSVTRRKRTGCLTAFLIFGFIVGLREIIRYLIWFNAFLAKYGENFYFSLLLAVINLVIYIGIWKWKKWAVEAWIIVGVVRIFYIFAYGKFLTLAIISFLIDFGFIILVIRPNWKHFK
jgi:predicted nucleic acid-binding Zn ribbon protein